MGRTIQYSSTNGLIQTGYSLEASLKVNLASLASWKEELQTVDVYEIIYELLLWNYNETRAQWRTVS